MRAQKTPCKARERFTEGRQKVFQMGIYSMSKFTAWQARIARLPREWEPRHPLKGGYLGRPAQRVPQSPPEGAKPPFLSIVKQLHKKPAYKAVREVLK